MTEFVLVSCSKSKQDGTFRAEDLYEPSDIFRKRRRFRRDERVHWGVLSAEYGYLRPWQAVDYYQKHISDRTPVWGAFVLDDLLADLEHFGVDQVTVLAGQRYVDPLVAELEGRGYEVVDYNRGLRPGERKAALKKANAPGEQAELVTDGGTVEDGIDQTPFDGCPECGGPLECPSWADRICRDCGEEYCHENRSGAHLLWSYTDDYRLDEVVARA